MGCEPEAKLRKIQPGVRKSFEMIQVLCGVEKKTKVK
jgi:hypothetical protein